MHETIVQQDKAAHNTSAVNSSVPHRSRYLANEPPIALYPSLALAFGSSDRAVFLQQLNYWLTKSSNYRDGRYWVYNSLESWREQFPWLSVKTIQRIISFFREKGIVITANYNRNKTDRTIWYTIDDQVLGEYLESGDSLTPGAAGPSEKVANASGQIDQMEAGQFDQPHTDNLTDSVNQRLPETTNRDTRRNSKLNPTREEATQKHNSTGHDLHCEIQRDTSTHTEHVPEGILRQASPALPGARPGIKTRGREAGACRKVADQVGAEVKTSRLCVGVMSLGLAQGLDLWQSPTKALKGGQEHHSENTDSAGHEWLRDTSTRPDLSKLSNERLEELNMVIRAAADFQREFADPNPKAAAVALGNLFLRSGRTGKDFYDVMLITRQELRMAQGQQPPGTCIRNKGAYFYASVRNNLERVHTRDASSEPRERPESDFCPQGSGFVPSRQNGPLRDAQARGEVREIRRAS